MLKKIFMAISLIFLGFMVNACQDTSPRMFPGDETTTESVIDIALRDLDAQGYDLNEKDNAYLEALRSHGETYEHILTEWSVTLNEDFSAYILVFDSHQSAIAFEEARIFASETQVFYVYDNLLIAAVDTDVIGVVTGIPYTSE
jgi:hypothetical protein